MLAIVPMFNDFLYSALSTVFATCSYAVEILTILAIYTTHVKVVPMRERLLNPEASRGPSAV